MQWSVEKVIKALFTQWYGSEPLHLIPLPASGSNRQYFRLTASDVSVVAAFNPDKRENLAFIKLSCYFKKLGLPVPEILAEDADAHCYLITDLGDTTLFSLLPGHRTPESFDQSIMQLYKKAITLLPVIQVDAAKLIDFSICYPRHAFDRHSMMWDLNYFKYYFLKISGVPFDEQMLEDDFERFVKQLLRIPADYFMYRDFQSRNIMVEKDKVYFIDYQGGRKGPLGYDMASLLFDAKANIPFHQREALLEYYMDCLEEKIPVNRNDFRKSFYDLVIMRILQALGTYGFRGGVEKKSLFLQSVPYALQNLKWLAAHDHLPGHIPHLSKIIRDLAASAPDEILPPIQKGLTLSICSFSYRQGIPADQSGNGGGFVFDCRALPNPGRQETYLKLTGKDAEVIHYLQAEPRVGKFVDNAMHMVEPAVENYLERGFNSLVVCFGCTGGQHRSVYCAELLARRLQEKYPIHIKLQHFNENNWPEKPT